MLLRKFFTSVIVALVEGQNFGVTRSTIVYDVNLGVFIVIPVPVPRILNDYSFS